MTEATLTTPVTLLVSSSPDRTSPASLNGATLTRQSYIFTSDATRSVDPSGIEQVRYWLDDPAMTRTPTHVEKVIPYDFAGTHSDGSAVAWSPSGVSRGTHTLTQSVTQTSGRVITYTATFTVAQEPAPTVAQWSPHDIDLTSTRAYGDPYTDVTLTATFTSPAGTRETVLGFWDGGNAFKVRFAPTVQGTWSYSISSSPFDAGLTRNGTLEVLAPNAGNHGFLRRDPDHPYDFVYDDGTHFFVMGQTYYGLILNALDGGSWKTAVARSKAYGFTKVRLLLYPWAVGTGTHYGHPYAQPFTTDHDHIDVGYWQKMDQVISYFDSQGMVADLVLFADDPIMWGTSAQNDRYLRYAIGRYAAYPNVTWCLSNEWNYTGQPQTEFDHLGGILASQDPYVLEGGATRALSVHQQTRIDFQFFGSTWPTHAIIQYGPRNRATSDGDVWGNAGISYNRKHDIPVVNDEYGYIDPSNAYTLSSGKSFSETRATIRNAIWGIVTAGGFGTLGGDDTLVTPSNMPIFSGDWYDEPGPYGDIRVLSTFMRGVPYWLMSPENSIVSGNRVYAFGTDGDHVIYAAAGGPFTVNLTGACSVSRVDPRTGAVASLPSKPSGSYAFATPDDQDYVYRLTGGSCR